MFWLSTMFNFDENLDKYTFEAWMRHDWTQKQPAGLRPLKANPGTFMAGDILLAFKLVN